MGQRRGRVADTQRQAVVGAGEPDLHVVGGAGVGDVGGVARACAGKAPVVEVGHHEDVVASRAQSAQRVQGFGERERADLDGGTDRGLGAAHGLGKGARGVDGERSIGGEPADRPLPSRFVPGVHGKEQPSPLATARGAHPVRQRRQQTGEESRVVAPAPALEGLGVLGREHLAQTHGLGRGPARRQPQIEREQRRHHALIAEELPPAAQARIGGVERGGSRAVIHEIADRRQGFGGGAVVEQAQFVDDDRDRMSVDMSVVEGAHDGGGVGAVDRGEEIGAVGERRAPVVAVPPDRVTQRRSRSGRGCGLFVEVDGCRTQDPARSARGGGEGTAQGAVPGDQRAIGRGQRGAIQWTVDIESRCQPSVSGFRSGEMDELVERGRDRRLVRVAVVADPPVHEGAGPGGVVVNRGDAQPPPPVRRPRRGGRRRWPRRRTPIADGRDNARAGAGRTGSRGSGSRGRGARRRG
ncbi:hypothetical protein FNL39_10852 [Nocardia caishijiensis]|uniref:Uncharacterized protein n=1 Tax=Nocardia caishijiensis TaxID=184756 RepID=A0ABQ6YHJ7_9NOCA|nr:hypothetical protein FNL39_10852 [Nocardia caishijiensis]